MDADLAHKLEQIEKKVDAVHASAEKTRKYILAVAVVTVIAFVLPLIGLIFAVPTMLSSYNELLTL